MVNKRRWRQWLLLALACTASAAATAGAIQVTYAGSMGVVMDRALGPAFAQVSKLDYQGRGEGAYGMARLLAGKKIVADVFVSITPGPIDVLKQAGLVDTAVPVASTRMVIAYNPRGKFAAAFDAAKAGQPGAQAWWQVLQSPGLRFARSDPAVDPQGQNIVFTMMLAEKYYHQPGLAQKILGPVQNPQQVYGEGGLLARLDAGQVDAASGYESASISARQAYITLPDEINLSNPTLAPAWYDTVSFTLDQPAGKTAPFHPQPLVFYAAVLKNAPNPAAARQFVDFLLSAAGQQLLKQNGYGPPQGDALYQ